MLGMIELPNIAGEQSLVVPSLTYEAECMVTLGYHRHATKFEERHYNSKVSDQARSQSGVETNKAKR
jgi:hypothetical protein